MSDEKMVAIQVPTALVAAVREAMAADKRRVPGTAATAIAAWKDLADAVCSATPAAPVAEGSDAHLVAMLRVEAIDFGCGNHNAPAMDAASEALVARFAELRAEISVLKSK